MALIFIEVYIWRADDHNDTIPIKENKKIFQNTQNL